MHFTLEDNGVTRVDLEHRSLERSGDAAEAVCEAIDSPEGWAGLLANFVQLANREKVS